MARTKASVPTPQPKERDWSDYVYLIFFVLHIPITLIIPPQFILPKEYIPKLFQQLLLDNINSTKDPILSLYLQDPVPAWIMTIFATEIIFQLPFFVYASYCLYKNQPCKVTSLLYCAHVLTTNAIVVSYILQQEATVDQLMKWLFTYAPFTLIPFLYLLDILQ